MHLHSSLVECYSKGDPLSHHPLSCLFHLQSSNNTINYIYIVDKFMSVIHYLLLGQNSYVMIPSLSSFCLEIDFSSFLSCGSPASGVPKEKSTSSQPSIHTTESSSTKSSSLQL